MSDDYDEARRFLMIIIRGFPMIMPEDIWWLTRRYLMMNWGFLIIRPDDYRRWIRGFGRLYLKITDDRALCRCS
jgi:hypothetical protein